MDTTNLPEWWPTFADQFRLVATLPGWRITYAGCIRCVSRSYYYCPIQAILHHKQTPYAACQTWKAAAARVGIPSTHVNCFIAAMDGTQYKEGEMCNMRKAVLGLLNLSENAANQQE